MKKDLQKVVIFGRTNVGKSTLFNKLTEKQKALISALHGTTRDINIDKVSWTGKTFFLIDTGGIMEMKNFLAKKKIGDDIDARVQKIAKEVLGTADLILFLVDQKAGLTAQDRSIAKYLQKNYDEKKIILVVNKADSVTDRRDAVQFYKLAIGEPFIISANSGSGTGDLLDEVVKRLKKRVQAAEEVPENAPRKSKITDALTIGPEPMGRGESTVLNKTGKEPIKVCIMGQPNVGKSSLVNKLLGYERVIVSPIAHTTREPQDIELDYKDKHLCLVDTAGLTKRGRANLNKKVLTLRIHDVGTLDRLSVHKSFASLNRSDIAIAILDITQPITNEDAKILEEVNNRKKGLIIVANKWDLIPNRDTVRFTNYIRGILPFVNWAPIQFISALSGEKNRTLLDLILKINDERNRVISDNEADRFLRRIVKIIKPMKGRGQKHPRIFEFKQVKTNPPHFEVRIGQGEDLAPTYLSFMEKRLREKYGFDGTPIKLRVIRERNEDNKLLGTENDTLSAQKALLNKEKKARNKKVRTSSKNRNYFGSRR